MPELSPQQAVQESEYRFPYHYLDLESDHHRLIDFAPVMSRYRLVRDRLGDVRGKTLLDAGCGDGRFCYEWRDSGARLIGVDFSARAIAFARAFVPEAEFHVSDIAALELEGTIDSAVAVEVLEHIDPQDTPGFLAALAACLKPGGLLVVTVPSTNRPVGRKHYRHFDEALLRSVLSSSFRVLSISGYARPKDLRLRIRKRMARLAFGARKGGGPLSKWVNGYADWYHTHYGEGAPAECGGLIATGTPLE